MTIEEAIKILDGKAEYWESKARKKNDGTMSTMLFNEEQAKVYRQLAEWLRELKAYRESRKEITRKMNSGQWSEGVVFGLDKAVRTMEKHLMEVNADE